MPDNIDEASVGKVSVCPERKKHSVNILCLAYCAVIKYSISCFAQCNHSTDIWTGPLTVGLARRMPTVG
jgi:hypothetical protein